MIESKNTKVRKLVASKQYKEALQICKEWDYSNPSYQNILRRGYECLMYPGFYKQLGYDPKVEYQRAVDILIEVYSN